VPFPKEAGNFCKNQPSHQEVALAFPHQPHLPSE